MDNVFGIGLPEFVLILVIAGMVMGPERIARSARSLGALTARLQTISRTFLRQLNDELDTVDETGQIKSTVEELNQLRRQVADLRNEVITLATGTAAETRQATRNLRREAENSILPPSLAAGQKKTTGEINGDNPGDVVYRPPSLAIDDSPRDAVDAASIASRPVIPPPIKLPKRVDVSEDPD